MSKKLAVIGCGSAAVQILKKAKELKIITYCFAKEETSSAKGLSDYFFSVDIFDIDQIYSICKQNQIDGVIATSEITTSTTAELANKLALPGNDYSKGFIFRNKLLMRQCLSDAKYTKQPKFQKYKENTIMEYPAIVKAPDSCGKKGISLVNNDSEFNEAIKYAKENTTNGEILIEEYLEGGIEYSVECLSSQGKHYIIQITQKDSSGAPHFAELGHHQPANINDELRQKVNNSINEILTKTGIQNSMSHVEIKIINNEIYFIELGARGGGDKIGDILVGLSTDYDYIKGAIEIAINQFTPPKVNNINYAGIYFLCKQTEYLKPLFEIAKKSDWCVECHIPENELIQKNTNDDNNTSGYLIYKSNHKITIEDCKYIAEKLENNDVNKKAIFNFYKKNERKISDKELNEGINKFLLKGNVIAIKKNDEIIAMLNIYINDYETKTAYLNNVEVIKDFRGMGLSKIILDKAIELVRINKFKYIALHVTKENIRAINLYKKYGFEFTNKKKIIENTECHEMIKKI